MKSINKLLAGIGMAISREPTKVTVWIFEIKSRFLCLDVIKITCAEPHLPYAEKGTEQ